MTTEELNQPDPPKQIFEAARALENWFLNQGIKEWEFLGVQSRTPLEEPAKSKGGETPKTDEEVINNSICPHEGGVYVSPSFARSLGHSLSGATKFGQYPNDELHTSNIKISKLESELAELRGIADKVSAQLKLTDEILQPHFDYKAPIFEQNEKALASWKAFLDSHK